MQLRTAELAICFNAAQDSQSLLHVSTQSRTLEHCYLSQRNSGLSNLAIRFNVVRAFELCYPFNAGRDART